MSEVVAGDGSAGGHQAEYTATGRVERIAVIVPMLNEADHVDHLVEDLAAQDFPGEVDVFVADGGSSDGSPALLREAAARANLSLRLLHNPRRLASAGLNACLAEALPTRPDLVVRLDVHSRYPGDYLRRCAVAFEETRAWAVGGVFAPVGRTPTERAVACALDSPFGGHNWTRHRRRKERVETDTFFCGAFSPAVFERVGGYDESVGVAEVEDLNIRIREAGGRVLHDPAIKLTYTPRGSFGRLFVQYYRYGLWKIPVVAKHRRIASGRSAVPQIFVASLALLAGLAPARRSARRLLAAELSLYAACALAFGGASLRGRGESWRLLPRVVAVFPTLHVAHGLGTFHGWLRLARRPRRN